MDRQWGDVYPEMATDAVIQGCWGFHEPLCLAVNTGMLAAPGKKLLEIGIGSGAFTAWFSEYGYEVVAVDDDARILKQAKRLVKARRLKKVAVEKADAFALPFEDGEFAVAFSQGLLEHYGDEQILALIEEMRRVANTVVFSVPTDTWVNAPVLEERRLSLSQWEEVLSSLKEEGLGLVPYWNGWMLYGMVPGYPIEPI